ncbi:MAG: phenylalanine--tRNA ligase beta subunit-related protein [Candidatus Caldarchaeum sp.]|nr:phenylalanine--tRNA ligase beta subunit-related protein [Candidatus Caldarchaeum sp.]
MILSISKEVKSSFSGLNVVLSEIVGVRVEQGSDLLLDFVDQSVQLVKTLFEIDALPRHPLVRAYRDFFWRIGIDPTKTRPSAEALLRRVLQGRDFPRINNLVDVYNVVSMKRAVPMAAFDMDKLRGSLVMRFARRGEVFQGIGMDKPMTLTGQEVVVEDDEKLVAVYPYRDAETSKVTDRTRNVLLMVCGVPGISVGYLQETAEELVRRVVEFCGGTLVQQTTV